MSYEIVKRNIGNVEVDKKDCFLAELGELETFDNGRI
jgi:hypothetical protein